MNNYYGINDCNTIYMGFWKNKVMLRRGGVNFLYCTLFSFTMVLSQYHGHPRGSIMNNIMNVHKLSINLDINRYIEYTLMYIGYQYVGYKCVGYVFIYTLMYSCINFNIISNN